MTPELLQLTEEYRTATDEVEIIFGEPMRAHTSFGAGGGARLFLIPRDEEALAIGLGLCRRYHIPVYILGKGTNLLVSDRGLDGAVFDMTALNGLRVEENRLIAQAGVLLRTLANAAAEASLSGLEFAQGIPGSVGGAVVMNAGAYDGEIKNTLTRVRLMDRHGEVRTVPAQELDLGYRHSALMESGEIVLEAEFVLSKGERSEIEAKMKDFAERRAAKQPLTQRSAGSTFKRPAGHFAGGLIEEAGLKGFAVGDAAVSEKHAGFVVNRGHARAADIYALCRTVQSRVEERFGVPLELEIRLWGSFDD